MRRFTISAALALISACAPLTAERPLFTLADQAGPAPLMEGVWLQTTEGCAAEAPEAARRVDCVWVDLSRGEDGAWLYQARSVGPDGPEEAAWRVLIIPAVETNRGQEAAPLYVAEYVSLDQPGPPLYAVVAPVGVLPASEVRMVTMIDCDDALRDGPIPGVHEVQGEETFDRVCVADDLGAVREAARRAVIENLSVLFIDGQARFVRMSPQRDPDRNAVVASR
jgi:hypothetical protein